MPRADSLPPTPESPPALEPAELLHYLPIYRVLICRLCQYAIQPAAIPRHLKDLHHIYRSNRRPFMEYVSQFELADPQDVVPPNSHECPVPILPIESGVACTVKGCGHMCVTVKRMKSHWSTIHHEMGQEGKSWRNVKLQTFFRGNQLQYFEVGHDHDEILKERSEPTIVEFGHFDSSGSESSPISINFSETSDLDFMLSYEDLELLHHFQTSTYVTVSKNPESDKIWQIAAPELGKQYPFLMYAILACSAMHRAYLYPQQAQHLTLRATNYQDKALAGFRQVLANHVNRENCSAVFAFTSLLIIYVFASEDRDRSLLLCTPQNGDDLPPWLQFIRNGCAMLCHVWDAIENGPMRPLITEVEVAWGCSSDLRYWESLKFCEPSVLSFMPPQDSHLAWTEQESMVYIRSAVGLGKTFESVTNLARPVSTWDAMHMWPMHVSEDYIRMLSDWHPGALILMAHFCVLLKRLESNWYFEGRATKMLSLIWARLSHEWRWTLQWPVQQLGLAF